MITFRLSGTRVAEIIGLGWALGMALYTAVFFTLYIAGVSCAAAVAPALVVTMAGVVTGVAIVRRMRNGHVSPGGDPPAAVAAGLGLALVQMALTVWMALHSLLRHGDAWTVWALKARIFALDGPPAGYFHQAPYQSHPNYPLNLPLAEALFFRLPDPAGLQLAALVGAACLGALLLLFYAGLARLYGRGTAALAVGALMMAPSLSRFAAYGYADVPLALYGGASALYLLLWWRLRQPLDLALMGLMAGGAIWTKKEGLPVALLLLLALTLGEMGSRDAPSSRRVVNVARGCLAALVLPLPWLLFSFIVRPVGADFLPMTPATFVANLNRLPTIVLLCGQEALRLDRWSLFWIVLAALVVLRARRLSPGGGMLLAVFVAQIGVYLTGYVFSNWSPYTLHIGSSLNRLILQATPLGLLVMVETIQSFAPAHAPGPWHVWPGRRSSVRSSGHR